MKAWCLLAERAPRRCNFQRTFGHFAGLNHPNPTESRRAGLAELEKIAEDGPNDRKEHIRSHGNPNLPIPAVAQPRIKLKHYFKAQTAIARREKKFDPHSTIKKNEKYAPFSTALEMNPYAHALATPIRMCQITKTRLPTPCLLDMHLATDADTSRPALMPTSMTAAQVSRRLKPEKVTDEQFAARQAHDEDSATNVATGAASYMLGQRMVVKYVTGKKRRWQKMLNHRMQVTLEKLGKDRDQLLWHDDMPDLMLAMMRKIVANSLRFFMQTKKNKEKPGILREPVVGLALEDMNNVACVLQLKEPDIRDSWNGQFGSESGSYAYAAWCPVEQERWLPKEEKANALQLHDLSPLPPPDKPPRLYYPVVPYRNRHVPVYNLKRLLGEDVLQRFLEDTVFKDSAWLTLEASKSTVPTQMWLMKLSTYLNEGQERMP